MPRRRRTARWIRTFLWPASYVSRRLNRRHAGAHTAIYSPRNRGFGLHTHIHEIARRRSPPFDRADGNCRSRIYRIALRRRFLTGAPEGVQSLRHDGGNRPHRERRHRRELVSQLHDFLSGSEPIPSTRRLSSQHQAVTRDRGLRKSATPRIRKLHPA